MTSVRASGEPRYSVAHATGDAMRFGAGWGIGAGAIAASRAAGAPAARLLDGAKVGGAVFAGFVGAAAAEAAGYGLLVRGGVRHDRAHAITSGAILAASGAGLAAVVARKLPGSAIPVLAGAGLIGACVAVSAVTGGRDPLHRHSELHAIADH